MAEINIDLELRSKLISRYYIKSLFWKQLHQRRRNILDAENSSRCNVQKVHWDSWLKVVKERAAASYEKDLLQKILEGDKSYGDQESLPSDVSLDRFIVDNCKAIYLPGHETTAITASWCLMLLAANQEWKARARAEVLEICKNNLTDADADMLRNMKTLPMVIQETMRLYPPVVFVIRRAQQDLQFKYITIPKGINIQIPIPVAQQNPDLWGPDAHQFIPKRFAKGILGSSTSPSDYMPFQMGARIRAGQHFAMAGLILSLSYGSLACHCHQHTIIHPGLGWLCNLAMVLAFKLEKSPDISSFEQLL